MPTTAAIEAAFAHVTTEDLRAALGNARKMTAEIMKIGIAFTARTGDPWHGWTRIVGLAREDAMHNAEGETRLTIDAPIGACVGPCNPATHYQRGTWRIALHKA